MRIALIRFCLDFQGILEWIINGGFQLEFVSIGRVINHMTCYKFECSHWRKIYLKEKSFTRFALQSSWNYSIKSTEFKTGHVIYNSAYTYKFQLKTTKVDYKIKIMYLGLPITEAQRAYAGMSLAGWFTISISLIQFRNRGSFSISTRKENMIINICTFILGHLQSIAY